MEIMAVIFIITIFGWIWRAYDFWKCPFRKKNNCSIGNCLTYGCHRKLEDWEKEDLKRKIDELD